jgi:hypothetical protein
MLLPSQKPFIGKFPPVRINLPETLHHNATRMSSALLEKQHINITSETNKK